MATKMSQAGGVNPNSIESYKTLIQDGTIVRYLQFIIWWLYVHRTKHSALDLAEAASMCMSKRVDSSSLSQPVNQLKKLGMVDVSSGLSKQTGRTVDQIILSEWYLSEVSELQNPKPGDFPVMLKPGNPSPDFSNKTKIEEVVKSVRGLDQPIMVEMKPGLIQIRWQEVA